MLRAVTFDLWNTLVVERPPGLFVPRVRAWLGVLSAVGVALEEAALEQAHRDALTNYQASWLRNEPFGSSEATSSILRALDLVVDEQTRQALVGTFDTAGRGSAIAACPNAREVLERLRGAGIATALICDIGLTPSSALTPHLEALGLRRHLNVLTWSDVLGVYKPHALAFETTLKMLGVPAGRAIHVGDRRRTDVAGARSAGMVTARYRHVFDDDAAVGEADFVIDDLAQLAEIVGVADE